MVKDLNIPVKVKALPIVRENDGLAMSSRNAYLSKDQRSQALSLHQSLLKARQLIGRGERDGAKIVSTMKRLLLRGKSVKIKYIAIVNADDLQVKKNIEGKVLIALAVFVGKVRLIDNIILKVKKKN